MAGILFLGRLQCRQQVVEPLVALVPEPLVTGRHVVTSRSGSASRRLSRAVARRVRETRPACSSTFRCRETAGWDTLNGAASSATVASPSASRLKIARLVGSASAPNTRLSRSDPS